MTADAYTFWSFDTPGGPVMVTACMHPEADGERPDIPLGRTCEAHNRTWYWCLDLDMAWCDGGSPAFSWHAGQLVAVRDQD